ncbi:MAG: extracellular solute-binding protein [Microvirga sp.]|nr:extracellular solute-binding protein [Microvirga sp.]
MKNEFSNVSRRTVLMMGAAAMAVVASTSAFAQSDAALIEAAKAEGVVNLYSSASTGPTNALAQAFTEKYGIQVTVYRAGSAEVATRVQGEESAGRPQADALIIEEPALSLLASYLAEYDSPERAAIADEYKTPTATLIRMYVSQLGWNTAVISEADAPKDWTDLTDPKWKGRFGSLDPRLTATTLAWQKMVTDLYGESFLAEFGANEPRLYASTNAMSQAIVSGEIDLGITNSFGVIQMAATGAPMAGVIPTSTVLFGGNISVFANAANPNAARLLTDFAISAEGQSLINEAGATIPSHPDAVTPSVPSLAEISEGRTLVQPDYQELIANTPAMLEEWERNVQ